MTSALRVRSFATARPVRMDATPFEVHSFSQAISIAPLQVHYYSEHGYCVGVSRRSATASEGLVKSSYVAARAGFEPATLRTKDAESTKGPPRFCATTQVPMQEPCLPKIAISQISLLREENRPNLPMFVATECFYADSILCYYTY